MQYAVFMNFQCRDGQDYNSLYRSRLEEAEWAEKLGFYGVFLAEHAFCEHGRPSPAVTLANMAARTSRLRLGTAVSVLAWHNPLEVAQDYATLDIMSEGRVDFGVGRGGFKREFDGYGVDWVESQPRYLEALKIILQAWKGEPFSYDGEFFKIPEVAVNPVPVQRPHPPLWQPTLFPASMHAVVPQGITPIVGASFSPLHVVKKNFEHLAEAMENAGRTDMCRVGHPLIFLSDTVEKAREEAREGVEWLVDDFAGIFELPEGEVYPEQFKGREKMAQYVRSLTYEKIVEEDLMWIGDPNYVTDRLRWLRDECGANFIISNMSPGGMEHEKVAKSMELLATKVMPQLA